MFSESHAPGIQMLTNESTRFKYLSVGMASSESMQTRVQYRAKMPECNIERAFE